MVNFNIIEGKDNTPQIRRILTEEYFPEDQNNTLQDLHDKYNINTGKLSRVGREMLKEQGKPPILKGNRHKIKHESKKKNIYVRHPKNKYISFHYCKIKDGNRTSITAPTLQGLIEKTEEQGIKLDTDRINELKKRYK